MDLSFSLEALSTQGGGGGGGEVGGVSTEALHNQNRSISERLLPSGGVCFSTATGWET